MAELELKQLGKKTEYPTQYSPKILEKFKNNFPDASRSEYIVELDCPEFTSLCPITGQPDFARIKITYSPDQYLVESKSLKLYLGSFRNRGSFHEEIICTVAKDLSEFLEPTWIEVQGFFTPRGGISINPKVRYDKKSARNKNEK
jgi:7-cyano-7-deazaguanine reductase